MERKAVAEYKQRNKLWAITRHLKGVKRDSAFLESFESEAFPREEVRFPEAALVELIEAAALARLIRLKMLTITT